LKGVDVTGVDVGGDKHIPRLHIACIFFEIFSTDKCDSTKIPSEERIAMAAK
jgi:hypothetical protein